MKTNREVVALPKRISFLAGKFGRAYWPVLLPWLLILAIAPLRELARYQIRGSALAPQARWQPWEPQGVYDLNDQEGGTAEDFDHRVDRFCERAYDLDGRYDAAQVMVVQSEGLLRQFPDVNWLPALCTWSILNNSQLRRPHDMKLAVAITAQAMRREPENGFPVLTAAAWELDQLLRVPDYQGRRADHSIGDGQPDKNWSQARVRQAEERVLALVHLAAAKPRFDAHLFDSYRCTIAAMSAHRQLTYEERAALIPGRVLENTQPLQAVALWCMGRARALRQAGEARRAVEISLDVGRLGALMKTGRNTPSLEGCGDNFIAASRHLFPRKGDGPRKVYFMPNDGTYVAWPLDPGEPALQSSKQQNLEWERNIAWAGANGLPEAARWMGRRRSADLRMDQWVNASQDLVRSIESEALRCNAWARNLGAVILAQLFWTSLAWLAVAGLCWPGKFAPAARRDRAGVAVACLLFCGICVALASGNHSTEIWPVLGMISRILSPGAQGDIADSLAILPRSAAVPFCWLVCATLTWRRHRDLLSPAGRVLPPALLFFQRAMLCYPFLLLGLAWAGWYLVQWLALRRSDTGLNTPLVPDGTLGPYLDLLLMFALTQLAFFLALWMAVWRWLVPAKSGPVTTGALRWFKETLGYYVVILSWMYFVLLVVQMPSRAAAQGHLDRILRQGTIGALYENKP